MIITEKEFKQIFKILLEYDKICPKGSRPGTLYGNSKMYKPVVNNLPKFRPILSAINTPGYSIVKFSIPVIKPLTE